MFILAFYAFAPAVVMYLIGLRKPILFYLALLIIIAVLVVGIVTGLLWSFFFVPNDYWHSMEADFPKFWFTWVINNADQSAGTLWYILAAPYVLVADFFRFYFYLNVFHGSIPLYLAESITWWWILVHGMLAFRIVGFKREVAEG
jgi:hypothetical protein